MARKRKLKMLIGLNSDSLELVKTKMTTIRELERTKQVGYLIGYFIPKEDGKVVANIEDVVVPQQFQTGKNAYVSNGIEAELFKDMEREHRQIVGYAYNLGNKKVCNESFASHERARVSIKLGHPILSMIINSKGKYEFYQ